MNRREFLTGTAAAVSVAALKGTTAIGAGDWPGEFGVDMASGQSQTFVAVMEPAPLGEGGYVSWRQLHAALDCRGQQSWLERISLFPRRCGKTAMLEALRQDARFYGRAITVQAGQGVERVDPHEVYPEPGDPPAPYVIPQRLFACDKGPTTFEHGEPGDPDTREPRRDDGEGLGVSDEALRRAGRDWWRDVWNEYDRTARTEG